MKNTEKMIFSFYLTELFIFFLVLDFKNIDKMIGDSFKN